jgi:hypothetical protein
MYTPEDIMKMVEQLKLYESSSHNKTVNYGNITTEDQNRTVMSILPNTIDEVINRSDYQDIIDHAQVFEVPIEVVVEPVGMGLEPVIYEVPVYITEKVDTADQ